MGEGRYPQFRRAQREGWPFRAESKRAEPEAASGFAAVVVTASVALFTAILFADRLPGALAEGRAADRNIDRLRAPMPGDHFPGCDAARAAGVAPLYAGEPGYRPDMDGDGDGIACEPYRGA